MEIVSSFLFLLLGFFVISFEFHSVKSSRVWQIRGRSLTFEKMMDVCHKDTSKGTRTSAPRRTITRFTATVDCTRLRSALSTREKEIKDIAATKQMHNQHRSVAGVGASYRPHNGSGVLCSSRSIFPRHSAHPSRNRAVALVQGWADSWRRRQSSSRRGQYSLASCTGQAWY